MREFPWKSLTLRWLRYERGAAFFLTRPIISRTLQFNQSHFMYSSIEGFRSDILQFKIFVFNESPKTFYFLSKNSKIWRQAHYATKLVVEIWRAALPIALYATSYTHSTAHDQRRWAKRCDQRSVNLTGRFYWDLFAISKKCFAELWGTLRTLMPGSIKQIGSDKKTALLTSILLIFLSIRQTLRKNTHKNIKTLRFSIGLEKTENTFFKN